MDRDPADEMLTRGRLSRIYYRGRFFAYPIKAFNALWNLGPVEAVRCLASYAWARLRPIKNPRSLEDWVRNQFGWRLFSIFFKTYTEKVWGISTKELSADWAAQRIKSLDLWLVVRSALLPQAEAAQPRRDRHHPDRQVPLPAARPGQMWERVAAILASRGRPVLLGRSILRIKHDGGRVRTVVTRNQDGARRGARRDAFHLEHSDPRADRPAGSARRRRRAGGRRPSSVTATSSASR